jgi:uroporphyrinogen-III synthase
MSAGALQVWISRSQPGADRQAQDIEAAGFRSLVVPVIGIEPDPAVPPDGPFDVVIFLSEHAVRLALSTFQSRPWFAQSQVLAVGERTATLLEEAGLSVLTPPEPTSEGLLALDLLAAPQGLAILLVSGAGGRDMLADTLSGRGARVTRHACYRRVPAAAIDPSVLHCDAIIAASGEGLRAIAGFWLRAGGRADIPVLVPSARVARLGVELGLRRLHDCGGADSAAWLRGLAHLQSAERR